MAYSDKVLDHYNNPRNVGSLDKADPNVGTGMVGAPECGDVMKLQIRVNEQTGVIDDAKFKTFGCGSAIASSSLATEWLKGKTVDEALTIKNTEIVNELSLPPVKIHCSVLAEDAIKAAIKDYKTKKGVPPGVGFGDGRAAMPELMELGSVRLRRPPLHGRQLNPCRKLRSPRRRSAKSVRPLRSRAWTECCAWACSAADARG